MTGANTTQGSASPLTTQLRNAFAAVGGQVAEGTLADWEQVKPALTNGLLEEAVSPEVADYTVACLEQDPNGPMAALTEVTDGSSPLLETIVAAYAQPSEGNEPQQAAEPALQVGDLDPTGAWQWDGTDWVAAGTTAGPAASAAVEEPPAAQPALQVGDLDPTGAWQWDGTDWVAAGATAAPTASTAAEQPSAGAAAAPVDAAPGVSAEAAAPSGTAEGATAEGAAAAAPQPEDIAQQAVDEIILPALTEALREVPELADVPPERLQELLAEVFAERVAAVSGA